MKVRAVASYYFCSHQRDSSKRGVTRFSLRLKGMEFTQEELELPPCKYEYLDHPADVQLHAWGDNLTECFEQVAVAMFGYMTEIDKVEILDKQEIEASSDDMQGLLFQFLDECLFIFSAEPFLIARKVVITEFDKEAFTIKASLYGEEFDLAKHPQGTEVKAITYASMQIYDNPGQHELFVIIDI
ncbi:protein archease-like isoform X1 [Penaeus japonicus]|uniref:protein archease-like isoform X1 n=2 Tax=Penaeus japonicus TaxID=27405 RepID=UPI001C710DEB|nr:protein archease-like isoform X1 [Penaeus japonicus]